MNDTLEAAPVAADSVYARLGGEPAIHALVTRFYELMDELPEADAVRRIHVERDEWLLCLRQALEEQVADEALRAGVLRAFTDTAAHIVNAGASRAQGCAATAEHP